jgi:hypothetical protein
MKRGRERDPSPRLVVGWFIMLVVAPVVTVELHVAEVDEAVEAWCIPPLPGTDLLGGLWGLTPPLESRISL